MKHILLCCLGLFAFAARADLVMQQQIASGKNSSAVTIKVKGTRIRVDMYAGQPQAISTIKDLKNGETLMLLHKQKMFIKQPGEQIRPATGVVLPKVRSTGKKEKLGGYDTEIYTWTNARGITGFFWVARNYPDYSRIKTEIAALDNTASGLSDGLTPALSTLPGMVLKTQITGGEQTLTVTLVSAREGQLDASTFQAPVNYRPLRLTKPQPQQSPAKPPGK